MDKKNHHAEFHGSDLELIREKYGIPQSEILSFSANINPLGLSPLFKESLTGHIEAITAYPDRDYRLLREAIGEYCHTAPEHILVGGGATDLISRFIHFLTPGQTLVVNPTYSEYAREVRQAGGDSQTFLLEEAEDFHLHVHKLIEALNENLDLLILCNPNNPTGSSVARSDLSLILSACETYGIHVLIDETYIEFSPRMEALTAIPLIADFDHLFVIRGVSKFFAAPGLRLGYGITGNEDLIQRLHGDSIPWGLNTYAALCAPEMFRDYVYIDRTRRFVREEMSRIRQRLKGSHHLHLYPSSANFFLMKILNPMVNSDYVFDAAIKEGMMIRDCASFPGLGKKYIRFCLCRPEDNQKLVSLLLEVTARGC